MRFTWGHGITIVFILFAGYILSFVYRSFFNEVDLVAEDYYAQEVAYQDRIDEKSNAKYLEDEIIVQRTSEGVEIIFPIEEQIDSESGTIQFFRPSDENLDIKLPLQIVDGHQRVPLELFTKGRYRVNIAWKSGGIGKYITKELTL